MSDPRTLAKPTGVDYQEETEIDTERTKQLLQRYRERVGLEVESEREHADEIDEAVRIGSERPRCSSVGCMNRREFAGEGHSVLQQ